MSEHAYNDPNIRARLEPKGELVVVKAWEQVLLETQTLQLLATVVDMDYGTGAMPQKSFFERITLELAIWPRSGKWISAWIKRDQPSSTAGLFYLRDCFLKTLLDTDATDFTELHGKTIKKAALFRVVCEIRVQKEDDIDLRNTLLESVLKFRFGVCCFSVRAHFATNFTDESTEKNKPFTAKTRRTPRFLKWKFKYLKSSSNDLSFLRVLLIFFALFASSRWEKPFCSALTNFAHHKSNLCALTCTCPVGTVQVLCPSRWIFKHSLWLFQRNTREP